MGMNRCLDCQATLKRDEEVCYACGKVVLRGDDSRVVFAKRFSAGLNVLFIFCAAVTVASLFMDSTPPFVDCAAVTGIIGLVRSSATQMLEKQSSGR